MARIQYPPRPPGACRPGGTYFWMALAAGDDVMNGKAFLWKGAQRARRMAAWGPRLMLAEARMRRLWLGRG